jgi:DNA-directed RNA polymerase subunit RPC12/RpoP
MDVVFQCPNCEQELEVDSSGAGSEIECPACGQKIVVPEPQLVPGAAAAAAGGAHVQVHPVNPIATSAAAKEEKHFKVPVHNQPSESLIAKPLTPLDVVAKDSTKTIRVKTIRRIDCLEVGHDHFDEHMTKFLVRVGEENVISITSVGYTYLDIGTQKLLTDYGALIVYRG